VSSSLARRDRGQRLVQAQAVVADVVLGERGVDEIHQVDILGFRSKWAHEALIRQSKGS
jgi:hypothetical protein